MVLGANTLQFVTEIEVRRIFIRLYKATYTKESPCLLPNKYSTTNKGIDYLLTTNLLYANLCCLVSYTYDVGTTSKRDACAIVSNLTLVNEFTID